MSDKWAPVTLYIYVKYARLFGVRDAAINTVPESRSLDEVFLKARLPGDMRGRYTRAGTTRREDQKGDCQKGIGQEDNGRQCATS
jgi:hypothetical protein